MKIRIRGNALRFRLTKSEVELFSKEGYLQEVINFSEDSLIYCLRREAVGTLTAEFLNNRITLLMPEQMAEEWTTTEKVGFESIYNNLNLLIEKDFKCLDNVAEDQSDNYPNPLSLNNSSYEQNDML